MPAPSPRPRSRICSAGMSVSTSTPSSEAEDHGDLLARRLPGAIEAAVARGGDLGEVDGHAAEFDAGREALDQAPLPAR